MVVFALTLIRHGETAHNKDNVIQGQMDVPLSQTGLLQAETLGFHLQYQQYSHIYASDLARAKQTAESIIKQNRSFKAGLLHDRRLRERKFGIVEGKSFKFLKEAAGKSNLSTGQYTPPGGETIQEVHERAVSFFQDLCQMVQEQSKANLSNDFPPGRTNPNSATFAQSENGKQMSQKRKWEMGEVDSAQKIECQNRSQNKICVTESTKQNEDDLQESLKSCLNTNCKYCDDGNIKNDSASFAESDCCSHKKNDSGSVTSNEFLHCKSELPDTKNEKESFSIMFTDDIIRSQIISSCSDLPNIECPNVSLSPLVDHSFITQSGFFNAVHENCHHDRQQERRLSVCSSCDDVDSSPILMANILVVSHGGWLRELFRHFVEDLECSVPGGKKQALRISPNAGLSKFTVSIEDNDGHPKIICLQIHDKQYLISNPYADNAVSSKDIAL